MKTPQKIVAIISYPFLPATTGGEISTLNLLKYLSHQHHVTVFTVEPYKPNPDIGTAKFELIYGMPFKTSRYWNLKLVSTLSKLIKTKQADWLFFDQPWFGWIMLALKIVTGKKIFIRSNNIEYLRFKSMGKWFWQMLYIYEKWTYRIADLVIFVSETDRQKAIHEFDLKPEKTLLTPYGVELEKAPLRNNSANEVIRNRHQIPAGNHILLFFSTLSYFPNYEAVQFIATEIYPLLKNKSFPFTLLLCGKGLPDSIKQLLADKPEIRYLGFVEDINEYIHAADVMINPILSGGGVKTKAIDTLAQNQRVVSTQNGAEGINPSVCGDNLVITADNDWTAFTDAIISTINKPNNIPHSFYETYGWAGIVTNLSDKLASDNI